MEIDKKLCSSSRTENEAKSKAGKNTKQQKCFFYCKVYILYSAATKQLLCSSEMQLQFNNWQYVQLLVSTFAWVHMIFGNKRLQNLEGNNAQVKSVTLCDYLPF